MSLKLSRKNKIKTNRGITLIALVITIIVLLILAGVTIATLTGDNGLLTKAGNAKNASSDAEIEEKIKLAVAESNLSKYMDNNSNSLNHIQESLRKTIGESANVSKMGKGYKIKIGDSKITYRVKSDGTVYKYEEMDPTPVYAKLDDEGNFYMRATEKDGYRIYNYCNSLTSDWNTAGDASTASVQNVIIEELIAPTTINSWFAGFSNLQEIKNIENLHTENCNGGMYGVFCGCQNLISLDVSNFDTGRFTSMNEMFNGCKKLTMLDVSNFDTSNVQSMYETFKYCSSLTTLDVSGFDTSKVTDFTRMFNGCSSLTTLDVSNFNKIGGNIGAMFADCSSLKSIDVSNFNTSNIKGIGYLFCGCKNLTDIDLSKFEISECTGMEYAFNGCTGLKQLNIGNKIIMNENTNCDSMFSNNMQNIKIKTTQNNINIIKSKFTNLTNDNFERIE